MEAYHTSSGFRLGDLEKVERALRLAVEKADRLGGEMKYCDLTTPENPQGLCRWYQLAVEVLGATKPPAKVAPSPGLPMWWPRNAPSSGSPL
jgi:hypothetical protein